MNLKNSIYTIVYFGILAQLLPTFSLMAQSTTLPNVKYVRFEKAGAIISIAEVIIKSGGNNIAQAGIAAQSSTEYNGLAAFAIDGNTDGKYFNSSVTHTAPNDYAPWWQLSLPEPSSIEEIIVWNRTDAVSSRLEEVRLVLLDEARHFLAESALTGDVSNTFSFTGGQLVLTGVTKKASLFAQESTSFSSIDGNPGRYRLHYDQPAPLTLAGWEAQSLPLGNGHFGVSFFGGIAEELWQFSEKSLCVRDDTKSSSDWDSVGLSNLMELRLSMTHGSDAIEGYGRELELDHAIGRVRYAKAGVEYRRELLTSYPDRVFAVRLTASELGKLSFTLNASQPFLGASRTGTATAQGAELVLKGVTKPFELAHEIRIAVDAKGGAVTSSASGSGATLQVSGSDEVVVYVTLGTSYQLTPNVFLQSDANKLTGYPVPTERIKADLASAIAKGFTALLERHVADYSPIFERAVVNFGGKAESYPLYLTNQLLREGNKTSEQTRFLEELYFQYGRYLLIASSRKGTLPANLQGTWNMTRNAPWTGGYWANINIQMNYWPAFCTNIEETFEPYWKFFEATFAQQQKRAKSFLGSWSPTRVIDNGWTAGTANSAYYAGGPSPTSGAGTGPFVILLLWDWYNFTGDKSILEKIWPMVISSCRFLDAFLKLQPDGTYLCDPSWSPEMEDGNGGLISLPGTAYDQQLVYENYRIALEIARILNRDDPVLNAVRTQLPLLSPVLIGTSGQIKEFRQEQAYGQFGDPNHRHIAQLVGLHPGTLITEKQEWLDAAKVSLNARGDNSTGWAMALRLNAWARIRDGNRCHSLLHSLLNTGTMENLWDTHPPFQIDGNFGGTSGMSEMLLQSHNGIITPIPAIPDAWKTGSFNGLKARGGYTIAASWNNKMLTELQIHSAIDKTCVVALGSGWIVYSDTGVVEPSSYDSTAKMLSFEARAGRFYHFSKTLLNTQTITFPAIGDQVITSRAVNLSATASSGLPVSFSVVSGPAAVRGTVLKLTGMGSVTVRALQVGNSTYAPITTERTFNVLPVPNGPGTGITREWWTGITGIDVSNLTSDARYPASPSGTEALTQLFEAPNNWAENFGQRLHGYFIAPLTGSYTFYIASDDSSELWLSTNGNPSNASKIARVSGYCGSREWSKYPSQQSVPITLNAGNRYYISALHKEAGGGDNLAVGVDMPEGYSEKPIAGHRLDPWMSSDSDYDGLADTWEMTHFGNLDQTSGDDFEKDSTNNLTEFRLGLDPKSSISRFAAVHDGGGLIQWPSVTGVTFRIMRSTTLAADSWIVLEAALPGTAGTANYTDPSPPASNAFYKIGLNP